MPSSRGRCGGGASTATTISTWPGAKPLAPSLPAARCALAALMMSASACFSVAARTSQPGSRGNVAAEAVLGSMDDRQKLLHRSALPHTFAGVSTFSFGSRGTMSISLRTMSSGLIPSASALKLVMMRCRSTGRGHGAHVLAGDVIAAVQHRPRLGRQDQELRRPRPGAPGHVVAHEVRHVVGLGPGLPPALARAGPFTRDPLRVSRVNFIA